jgi:heptosyltransferase I
MNIAIVRLSSLGDIVHTVPAAACLRDRFPDARITWLAEPAGARLLDLFSGIDEVQVTELRRPGLAPKLRSLRSLLKAQRGRFDVVLDFQGLIKSAVLSRLLGGERLGFHRRDLREPAASLFYSRRAGYVGNERHVIQRNLNLLTLLGVSSPPIRFPFKPPLETPELDSFLADNGLTGRPWLALNVGGGWPTKVLPPDRLIETARLLRKEFPVLLLWGTPAEQRTAICVAAAGGGVVAPALDFSGLLAMLRRAGLLISGDTLPLHLADAAGVRTVGLFGPTSPQRNGPLLPASAVLTVARSCRFCYRRKCDTMDCLAGLDARQIVETVRQANAKRD